MKTATSANNHATEQFEKLKKEAIAIGQFITSNEVLREQITSIYVIGSFARGQAKDSSDIDLNFFLNNNNYSTIILLKKCCDEASKYFNRRIDINIITKESILDNLLNSNYFVQKNRHAFFLYELVMFKLHIYGEDILNNIKFNISDLLGESVKLLHTLVYRLNKLILSKNPSPQELQMQALKYTLYACEYSLINKGIHLNRSISIQNEFFNNFSHIKIDHEFIKMLYVKRSNKNYQLSNAEIGKCYDSISTLANHATNKFLTLRNYSSIILPSQDESLYNHINNYIQKYHFLSDINQIKVYKSNQLEINTLEIKCDHHHNHLKISVNNNLTISPPISDILINSLNEIDILFKYRKSYEKYNHI